MEIRRLLLWVAVAGNALTAARAAIPSEALADPLYAKGYIVVSHYAGVNRDGANAAATTAGLNEAIDDAYAHNLIAYFPTGTYLVNDTLTAITKSGWDGVTDDFSTHGTTLPSSAPLWAVVR